MVTDQEGYIHLIEYLTKHLSLFENITSSQNITTSTIIETIEEELSCQIINVCQQNQELNFNERNTIIREVDSVLYDLEEVLAAVLDNWVTEEQTLFIKEFCILIKSLFDEAITTSINTV
ncbi:DUF3802 family protein [Pseudocolwellia sp. AS88]|jgi:hypothetical protein|uniref:DUF3802 family protein n=1 Tax=Pseudocolwellia sp. AS88 TaxID=3063958 RepID=UPI0026F2F713|nr:DUF3802 family protein [Pseudocolwellia sp. AS88]MDO7085973.1 DUF3802 family protein [Pseudocolwellia sp. AS88]